MQKTFNNPNVDFGCDLEDPGHLWTLVSILQNNNLGFHENPLSSSENRCAETGCPPGRQNVLCHSRWLSVNAQKDRCKCESSANAQIQFSPAQNMAQVVRARKARGNNFVRVGTLKAFPARQCEPPQTHTLRGCTQPFTFNQAEKRQLNGLKIATISQ